MNNYDQYDQESQALLHGIKPLSFEEVMGSRQQDFFKSPNNGSSPDYVSPFAKQFEFKSLTSKEIADNYFNNIKPVQKGNIAVYQEPETKTDVILKKISVYRDNDPTKGFQEGRDVLLYKILAYISTSQSKLKDLYLKSENRVEDNEILLFLEDNTNDFSDQYLFARFGKSVKKEHLLAADQQDNLIKLIPDFSSEMLQELIQTGQVKAKNTITGAIAKGMLYIVSFIGLPGKAIGWVCDEIGDAISNYLTIPETVWDSKGEEYFLKRENVLKDLQIDTSFINTVPDFLKKQHQYSWFNSFLSPQNTALFLAEPMNAIVGLVNNYNIQVQQIIDSFYEKNNTQNTSSGTKITLLDTLAISEQVAFLCGIWNGLVDFIAGTFKFLAMALSAQYDFATNHQEIMEELDELYANIKKIKFTDVLIPAVVTYFQIFSEINKFFTSKNPTEEYNFDKIAYFTGFGLAFIATAFIPYTQLVKVSGITKASKLIPEEFLSGLSQVKGGAVNGIKPMLVLFREMSGVLAKGTNEIMAFFQRIKKAIVEWFKINLKKQQQFIKYGKALLERTAKTYAKKYPDGKLYKILKVREAYNLYGKLGKRLVQETDISFENIIKLRGYKEKVMISGMLYKGDKTQKVFTAVNFTREEKIAGKVTEFIEDMHPVLRKRYDLHLKEISKGLNATPEMIKKAGIAASHGEIRAVNQLLHHLKDTGVKVTDDIFKDIIGYNRYLIKEGSQPPCVHCFYLTDDVLYLKLLK